MNAKAKVDAAGIGAEPASCATVAGIKKLVDQGIIDRKDTVAGILTGNILKDPDATVNYHMGKLEDYDSQYANKPIVVDADIEKVKNALKSI